MTHQLDDEWSQFVHNLQETNQFGHPSFYASFTTPSQPIIVNPKKSKQKPLKNLVKQIKPPHPTHILEKYDEQNDDEEDSLGDEDEDPEQLDQVPLRPITKNIPPCPITTDKDLHFSTRTQSMRVNCSLDIEHLFWNLPVIDYWKPEEGIVKKEMKQITKEEVQHLIDLAITRHNRNASIISLVVGLTVLGFYADGLFRTVEKLTNLN